LETSLVLLYIEPPRIEEIPDCERSSVALFVLKQLVISYGTRDTLS